MGERRGLILPAAVVVVGAVLAGCTGQGSGASSGGSSGTPAASAPPSAASSGLSAPTSGSGSGAASAGASGDVATALQDSYRRVISHVLPSVVEIRTPNALGSGVVLDAKGDIVTNAHVVGTSTTFEVLTSGSARPLPATLVGTYLPDDLAVIRVSGATLRAATFADSSKAHVGDIVLAMGNPLGLAATVTNGIISALGRTPTEPAGDGSPGATLPDTIQTSAAINPGNSGGALVNLDGQVVGIPTLAATSGTSGAAAPGIGFAISSNRVRTIATQLAATGRVSRAGRAALGVRVTSIVDASGTPQGVGVVGVTAGGPAASAGIRAGDVITTVAGQPTPDTQALGSVLAALTVGQKVPVTVVRGGTTQQIQVVLGDLGKATG